MTQQIMLTRTLNAHAMDVAIDIANDADARNIANNDRRAFDALVRDYIATTLARDARNDDDDDARAFASYLVRHDDATDQPARYRRRVVMFARNVRHARAHGTLLNVNKYTTRAFVIFANDDDNNAHAFDVIASHRA